MSLSLPPAQQAVDIGSPAITGSVTYRQGVYTHHAAGANIWGSADQFNFVYQAVTGDVDVVARVASIRDTNPRAKSGVMIREDLTPGSRHAFANVTAERGIAFERRVDPGATTARTTGSAAVPPEWVRLVRTGATIEAFSSDDGVTWTSIGSDAIPMADSVYVGIATTSHNAGAATDAVLDHVTITPASATTNQPPQVTSVTLNAPSSGATYTAPAVILLSASASDPENALTRVEFYSGSTLIATAAAEPFVFTWTAVPAGTYMLRAVAYDGAGASASSATATITVANPLALRPSGVAFTPSVDHASVTRYELRIYASGANPLAATAIATSDLGKPTPDATGDITVDRAAFFSNLPVGNFVAAVAAIGAGGESVSTGVTFTR